METDQTDYVVVKGINSDGYGTVPKMIMRDDRLSIGAKAVYAYFCSYAGAGESAFPRRKRVLKELSISYNSFRKYRGELESLGYITVIARTRENGSTSSNLYVLNSEIAQPEQPKESSQSEETVSNFDTPKSAENTITAGRNRVSNFEPLPKFETPSKPKQESKFEQGGVSKFEQGGVSKFDPPYISNNNTTNNKINNNPTIQPSDVVSRKTGNTQNPANNIPSVQPTDVVGLDTPAAQPSSQDGWMDDVFEELCSLSLNRTLLTEARPFYDILIGEGYRPQEILRAWKATLRDKENRETRFQPQLKAWLEGTRDDNARVRINKTRSMKKPAKQAATDEQLKAEIIDTLRQSEPDFDAAWCQLLSLRTSLMVAILTKSKSGETNNGKVDAINQEIAPLQEFCEQRVNEVFAQKKGI